MENYSTPKIRVVVLEPRSSYLLSTSDISEDTPGGGAENITIIVEG